MSQSSISYLWREPEAAKSFTTGVSLHSHTNQSQETLDFVAELSKNWGILQPLMRWCESRCNRLTGIQPDYALWADFLADTNAGRKTRSDTYLCQYKLTRLTGGRAGATLWTGQYETSKHIKKGLLD